MGVALPACVFAYPLNLAAARTFIERIPDEQLRFQIDTAIAAVLSRYQAGRRPAADFDLLFLAEVMADTAQPVELIPLETDLGLELVVIEDER